MQKYPLVSVIINCYNGEKYLNECIKCVLGQSYKNWEIVFLDNNSSDQSVQVINTYKDKRIKLFFNRNKSHLSLYKARNLAISHAKGEYITFLDVDDLWKKNKLKFQISFMQKNNYFFTYTNYKTFKINNPIKKTILAPSKFNFNSFVKNTSIATSTMIVKRSISLKIKFSNTKICEDYYYKCQLLKKIGNAYCYPGFLTEYQIRKDSLQSNRIRNLYWIWQINKKLNHFHFLKNLISIFFISLNSLKKYGFR